MGIGQLVLSLVEEKETLVSCWEAYARLPLVARRVLAPLARVVRTDIHRRDQAELDAKYAAQIDQDDFFVTTRRAASWS